MKTNSLIFKTRLIGFLSAFLLVALSVFLTIFFIFFDKQQEVRHLINFQKAMSQDSLPSLLEKYKLSIDTKPPLAKAENILYDPLIQDIFQKNGLAIYTYDGYYYYNVKDAWFKSTYATSSYKLYISFVILLLITLLIFLHFYIQNSLRPLDELNKQMKAYGEGKKITPLAFKNEDEIASLAKAFYTSMGKLKEVRQSRSLLINTLMNEFKSSLTKLVLRTHLLEDEKNKMPLLENMNKMQDQLLQIKEYETLMSGLFELNFSEYYLNSLIDEGLYDLSIKMNYTYDENLKISVDNKIFITALKALFLNASTYGTDGFNLEVKNKQLILSNKASTKQALDYEKLAQVFREENTLGLGIYISKMILEKHHLSLKYIYRGDQHFFIIDFVKN